MKLLLTLSVFFLLDFSSGFLQQHVEKYLGNNPKLKEDLNKDLKNDLKKEDPIKKRHSRSIFLLFPPDELEPPSSMQMQPQEPDFAESATYPPVYVPAQPTFSQRQRHNPNKPPVQQNNNPENCNPDCGCTKQYIPFCGSNGVTYRNKCQMNCATQICDSRIKTRFEGVCPVTHNHYRDRGGHKRNFRFLYKKYLFPHVF